MCVCEPPTLNTPVVRGIKPVNSPLKYSFLLCCHCCEETLKQLITHNSKLARRAAVFSGFPGSNLLQKSIRSCYKVNPESMETPQSKHPSHCFSDYTSLLISIGLCVSIRLA